MIGHAVFCSAPEGGSSAFDRVRIFGMQGAVVRLRWASEQRACVTASALLSLSSDGALLQWGPWDSAASLFPSGLSGRQAPAKQQLQQQQVGSPVDLGAALLASGSLGRRPALAAFDVQRSGRCVAVGCTNGALALFSTDLCTPSSSSAAAAAPQAAWQADAPGAAVSHVRLSPSCDLLLAAREDMAVEAHSTAGAAGEAPPPPARHQLSSHIWSIAVGPTPLVGKLPVACGLAGGTVKVGCALTP